MTIPLWTPFAVLSFLCVVCPLPHWMRRVDWMSVGVWSLALGFCGLFWFDVASIAEWVAS